MNTSLEAQLMIMVTEVAACVARVEQKLEDHIRLEESAMDRKRESRRLRLTQLAMIVSVVSAVIGPVLTFCLMLWLRK